MVAKYIRRALVGAGAVVLGSALLVTVRDARRQRQPAPAGAPAIGIRRAGDRPLPVLWDVPAFSAVDQDGEAVSEQTLRGHVWICAFIFTRCTTVCPIITSRMALLRHQLPDADVRFVSFTVDADFDTPAVLKQYAIGWSADARWLLLNAGADGVRKLARGMHAALESGRNTGNPIVHSSHFFLVDTILQVRGVYDSAAESALPRLVADASGLGAPPATVAVGATATGGARGATRHPVATGAAHAIDPVCDMMVPASAQSPHAEYDGKSYYFCSETCRDEFLRNPDRYVRPG